MKKKLILMCIAGALVMTAVIGGTLAGFNESTEQRKTNINVNSLAINVTDANTGGDVAKDDLGRIIISEPAMPGGRIEVDRTIENTGDYPIYIRVTVNKKWDDRSLSADSIQLDLESAGWITLPSENQEQIILYYTNPVNPVNEERTEGIIELPVTGISFDAGLTNEYANKTFELAVEVDAVQAVQGENAQLAQDAMLSEWGVFPVIDNGVITGIEE